jgi:L-iditol 2-dehydrogenase
MPERARAVTITEPWKLEVREYDIPPIPEGGLLMKIEMSGICGTDKHTYRGETTQYGGTVSEQISPFPLIPGHENVGIVADVKPGVVDFYGEPLKLGDRITMCPDVICGKCYTCRHIFAYSWCQNWRGYGNSFRASEEPLMGGWADYMVIIPEAFVYKVPDGLPPEVAVYTEILACAYGLDKAKEFGSIASEGFITDDAVLIQGVGPLGLCHLMKARMMGAGVIIAFDKSDLRLQMAKDFGADYVVNVEKTSEEERRDLVHQWTRGRGVDLAVECVGYPEAVPEALHLIRRGGMYLMEGVFVDMGDIVMNPHLIVSKGLRIIGLSNHPITGYRPSMDLMLRYYEQMPFESFVTHRFSLDEAQQAIDTALDWNQCMKVVFEPTFREG